MTKSTKEPVGSDPNGIRVRVYWGDILYDTAISDHKTPITIGREKGSTFVLDLGKSLRQSIPLIVPTTARTAELRFDDKTRGYVRFDGKLVTLEKARERGGMAVPEGDGLFRLDLTDKDKASVVIDYVSFDIDWVNSREKVPRPFVLDRTGALFSGVVSALFLALLTMIEVPEKPPVPEPPPERIVEILPNKELVAKAAMGVQKTADGGAAAGDAGKAEIAPPKVEKPSAAEALKSANLGNLVSSLSSLSQTAAPASDKRAAVAAAAAQAGSGGMSSEGFAKGAGGKSVGIGRTVGQGEGGFEGTGKLGLSGNSMVEGSAGRGVASAVTQGGGLDRAVIDQIVRRRQDRIRLCYERQLNFAPKLAGKVTVAFSIGAEGQVVSTAISEDTMKNRAVTDCISAEVKTWTFPRPSGGTLVKVDYPFVFEASGAH